MIRYKPYRWAIAWLALFALLPWRTESENHSNAPIDRKQLEEEFEARLTTWRREQWTYEFASREERNPNTLKSFDRLVELGPAIVPLILERWETDSASARRERLGPTYDSHLSWNLLLERLLHTSLEPFDNKYDRGGDTLAMRRKEESRLAAWKDAWKHWKSSRSTQR